jgi:mono/diheme cytochrome c family protein
MKLGSVCGLALLLAGASAQAQQFSAEQIKSGAALYVTYCTTCHG